MTTAYDFEFTAIDGSPLPLKKFEGQALLVVNVASKCGFTPQYAGLQKLYQDYHGRGLTVLGVPSTLLTLKVSVTLSPTFRLS